MPVISQMSSYSSRSMVGSKVLSGAGVVHLSSVGSSKSRKSSQALSVYGGAGGYGTRISKSVAAFSLDAPSSDINISYNERLAMQNLNDRLASYIEKVRSLEASNSKLELQIKTFYENRSPDRVRNLDAYFSTIAELRTKFMKTFLEHEQMTLQMDNARLTAEDFKTKYEIELNMRMQVESDTARLRGVLDSFTLSRSNLEGEIEGLREELVYIKKNHVEEMNLLCIQKSGGVNVEMDCAVATDLNRELEEMRAQYEAVVLKNQREAEKWFQSKVEALHTQIATSTTEVKSSQSEHADLRRSEQSLTIEMHGMRSKIEYLEHNLQEVNSRYSSQLIQLQQDIHSSESNLQLLKVSIQEQASEYKVLLDIKMRLELEIAEYRRLLDGEAHSKTVVSTANHLNTTSTSSTMQQETTVTVVETVQEVEVVEEHNPHLQRRVKVIVEEMVDGKVVSSSVKEKVEELN